MLLECFGCPGSGKSTFAGMLRDELPRWLDPRRFAVLREAVVTAGFERVALDLRGFRSGSLNVLQGVTA